MQNEGQNFEQLQRLLKLKQHEVPPPGYFNRLPAEVISRIREEQGNRGGSVAKLETEAPWLVRLFQSFQARPIYAGAFGAAVCAVALGGIYLTEKPVERPPYVGQGIQTSPFTANAITASEGETVNRPLIVAATNLNNSASPNLFDLVQPLQTAPVSTQPDN